MLGPMTYGALSQSVAAAAWTPASATTDGGVSAHTWHYAGSGAVYTDSAKTTLVSSDGDAVGASVNQGSDSHDVVQATTSKKPVYKTSILNGEPVFRTDGIDDLLQGAFAAGLSQPFTVYVVAKLDAAAVNDGVDHVLTDGDDLSNRMQSGQEQAPTPDGWYVQANILQLGGASNSNWNIWTILLNGGGSQFWHNGTSQASGNAGTDAADGLTLGANFNGSKLWPGDVAEILIYDSNLSTADKNQVGNYLAGKYSLTYTDIV